MSQSQNTRLLEAVLRGDVAVARELLAEAPELLHTAGLAWSLLYWAAGAEGDNVAMVEFLGEAGLAVNHEEISGGTALSNAARSGNVRVAKWLLDHGAKVRPTTPQEGGDVIGAANSGSLELVRLLLEHGADINAAHGDPPRNALSHALLYGHSAIADLLRAQGATLPPQPPHPLSNREEIIAHVERHLGPVRPGGLTAVVPEDIDVRVHAVPPSTHRPFVALFTTGLSDQPLNVPQGAEEYQHAELVIHLPPDWPVTLEELTKPEHNWPVAWLRKVADDLHANQTWLRGDGTIISNEEPPQPLGPGVGFTSLLLLTNSTPFASFTTASGTVIRFFTVFPLYTEERDLVLDHGPAPLLRLFQQHGIGTRVSPPRFNVAVSLES